MCINPTLNLNKNASGENPSKLILLVVFTTP